MQNNFYTARGYQLKNQMRRALSPSREDYLEMIYRSISQNEICKVSTLSMALNVRPSSVSKMLDKLKELNYIDYEKYGKIMLTKQGVTQGKYLLWRHNVIIDFFKNLSLENNDILFEEAELVEHILSRETVERINKLNAFIKSSDLLF